MKVLRSPCDQTRLCQKIWNYFPPAIYAYFLEQTGWTFGCCLTTQTIDPPPFDSGLPEASEFPGASLSLTL